jgi:hypothetical protein
MGRERWVAMGVALLLLAPLGVRAANRAKLDPEVASSGPAVFDASRIPDYSNDVLSAFLDIFKGSTDSGASDNLRLISVELSRRRESAAPRDSATLTARPSPSRRSARRSGPDPASSGSTGSEVTATRLVSTADSRTEDPPGAATGAPLATSPTGSGIIADRPSGDWYPDARRELEAARNDPDGQRIRRGQIYSTENSQVVQLSAVQKVQGVGLAVEEELANTSSGGGGGSGEMRAGGLGEP